MEHITSKRTETTVNGIKFQHWADFTDRCEKAENMETHEIKTIHGSGYISRDLTARKAIAMMFGLPTFRK